MKFNKKFAVMAICLALVFGGQGLFAKTYLPAEGQRIFPLSEVFTVNSALLNCDLLQFMQAYLEPDDPKGFYLKASTWNERDIEANAYYFMSFFYPQLAGNISFYYFSNLEEFLKETNQDVGPGPFEVNENLTTFDDLKKIYPAGIVQCDPYDMLRTTARQLFYYIVLQSEDGRSPSQDKAEALLTIIFQSLQQQYEDAMKAESEAEAAAQKNKELQEPAEEPEQGQEQ